MPLILVVDDEEAILELVTEMLAALNYDVRASATAAGALNILRDERPDAILLDIALPDASGTAALDQLRQVRSDVPVIMITGNIDERLARETLKHGAFDYVTKPFTLGHLARVLEAALAS